MPDIKTSCNQALPIAFLLSAALLAGQSGPSYPLVTKLDASDFLFKQLTQDIAAFYIADARDEPLPPLAFYVYSAKNDEDLYSIAAATGIGVEALATINQLDNYDTDIGEHTLLLPNLPGLFIPLEPTGDLEWITYAGRSPDLATGIHVTVTYPQTRNYVFLPGEKFTSLERAFFLNALFRFPLREGTITSEYGSRRHPISGLPGFHAGIDIGAPHGSEVLAARAGSVNDLGYDPELGNYIVLDHGGGIYSVYGHLSTIKISLSQHVKSGTVIGTVGSTGVSTGPHLHFEVHNAQGKVDPLPLIRGRK